MGPQVESFNDDTLAGLLDQVGWAVDETGDLELAAVTVATDYLRGANHKQAFLDSFRLEEPPAAVAVTALRIERGIQQHDHLAAFGSAKHFLAHTGIDPFGHVPDFDTVHYLGLVLRELHRLETL